MEEMAASFSNTTSPLQCWTCPVFDSLFNVISNSAAAAYKQLSTVAVAIFVVLFAFYVLNAVWKNIKGGMPDPFFQKSLRPVLIKAVLALSLLGLGVTVPKLISNITFEPAAEMAVQYTDAMLPENVQKVQPYQKIKLDDNGFFNPGLRDTIVKLMENSLTNFQVYIQIGFNIIQEAFSLKMLIGGISALIRHIIVIFIGLFITYKFAKMFIKYSFCFIDIIVAMAMFAFFFPLSIVLFIFRDAQDLPDWMKNLGKNFGGAQIKNIINAIATVAATILTYTIIMMIINGFLNSNGTDAIGLSSATDSLFNLDLDHSSVMQLSIMGLLVLMFIIEFIEQQISKITEKIMSTFGLSKEDSLSKEMGDNVLALTNIALADAKSIIKTIGTHGEDKKTGEEEKK